MHAREEVLGKQIGERNNFLIPLWQRRYSWTKPQWHSLWSDVLRQYEAPPGDRTHFIGSLILHAQEKKHVSNPTPIVVVDGQQRLLTTLILLAALRDYIRTNPSADGASSRAVDLFLFNQDADGDMRYRVVPQESDRSAFFAIMDGQPVLESREGLNEEPDDIPEPDLDDAEDSDLADGDSVPQHVIGDAFAYFRQRLTDLDLGGRALDPDRLLKAMVERLEIVAITLGKDDSYHRIFQTVNAEGVELRDVDLVRNYVFMLLGEDADAAYTQHWRPMEERLGTSFANFLISDLVVRGEKTSAQRKSIFSGYRKLLSPVENEPGSVRSVLKALDGGSKHFSRIIDDSERADSAQHTVDGRLRFLREWGSIPMQPLLFRLISSEGLSDEDLTRGLRAIESLVVRRFLVRTPPNDLRSRFTSITLRHVETKADTLVSRIVEELLEESARWPADEEVRFAVQQTSVYDPARARQVFLVLKRLGARVQGKEFPARVRIGREVGAYQIEHVLPQDASKWTDDLHTWGVDDTTAFTLARTDVLPNLVLTAVNQNMSNGRFIDKKSWLDSSSIALTREIAQEDAWGEEQILNRADRLSELIVSEWPYG